MDAIELNPFLGLPMSILPRYPPGVLPPTIALMNQKRLKEKFFQENASMTTKLQDFNQMYQKLASGLFEIAHTALPPGHPLFSRLNSSTLLKNENDKLRKDNLELKKQLEKNQKNKINF
jgi:hypothetical protein